MAATSSAKFLHAPGRVDGSGLGVAVPVQVDGDAAHVGGECA